MQKRTADVTKGTHASLGVGDLVILAQPPKAFLTEVEGRELTEGWKHRTKSVIQGNSKSDMKHLTSNEAGPTMQSDLSEADLLSEKVLFIYYLFIIVIFYCEISQ